MQPHTGSIRQTVAINGNLLGAVVGGFIAWVVWPSSAEWWGMGALSIGAGLIAFVSLIRAIGLIVAAYAKRRAIAAYMAKGGKPKSTQMATSRDLEAAGMIDG